MGKKRLIRTCSNTNSHKFCRFNIQYPKVRLMNESAHVMGICQKW